CEIVDVLVPGIGSTESGKDCLEGSVTWLGQRNGLTYGRLYKRMNCSLPLNHGSNTRVELYKPWFILNGDQIVVQTERPLSTPNHALTSSDMVLLALRFLAIGSFLQVAGDFVGIDKSTASRVVHKVTRAIANMHRTYISMPNEAEYNSIRQRFFNISRFPRCLGALDCTHIKIQSPGGDNPENYRNRKGYFSFNVQVVCDADLKIRDIVCRWPESAHDANIFRNCTLRRRFENGEFGENLLLSDSGYSIKPYLITPVNNPTTPAEQLFKLFCWSAQIRTRNTVERFRNKIKCGKKLEAIVVCCTVLHNIARQLHDNEIPPVNEDVEAAIELGNVPVVGINAGGQNVPLINNIIRNSLITEYFQSLL
ncbi:hypothetical protein NQ315_012869, partial [Exocentrus adspersus]